MMDSNLVLTQSTAIMDYVDDAFPRAKLMRENAVDQWRIRWWMKFMDRWFSNVKARPSVARAFGQATMNDPRQSCAPGPEINRWG